MKLKMLRDKEEILKAVRKKEKKKRQTVDKGTAI